MATKSPTKKTPMSAEEKLLRKQVKAAAEASAKIQAQFEREAALSKFYSELPKRLMDAQALATSVGVSTEVSLTETGPNVTFRFNDEGHYREYDLHYRCTEWEIEDVESTLRIIQTKQQEEARSRVLAQAAFNKLSDEEKVALKKNIHYIR